MAANAKPNGEYSSNKRQRDQALCKKHHINPEFANSMGEINKRSKHVNDIDSYQRVLHNQYHL